MYRLLPIWMFAALVLFPGCGQSSGPFGNCGTESDGKILLLWTVRQQPATATGCQGIDSLDLVLSPDLCPGSLEISPIPCERDGAPWRYDNLPLGGATVTLTARSITGSTLLQGSTRVTIGQALPATAAPIDLE